MRDVIVSGIGMTPFGKHALSVRTMAETALRQALDDAGLSSADVQRVFFANAAGGLLTGQEMVRGQAALRYTGILGVPLFNVENACASAASAFHLAWMSVASGACDVAVAVGSEELSSSNKKAALEAIGTAVPLEDLPMLRQQLELGEADEKRSLFMDIYGALTRRYVQRTGATVEDFADVAVKNHLHGSLNPLAQYRKEVTREEVLASRTVVDPLTLFMCAPIGDGAAAAVVCSPDIGRQAPQPAVRVRSSVVVSGWDRNGGDEPGAVERAAYFAFEQAGIGPEDLDVVEVHDATASAELMVYEDIGLCPKSEGPALLRSGATRLGGSLPVSPSGGLLARGHPIGATGLAQIVELVGQLRGHAGLRQVEGAQVALAENGGGFLGDDLAASAITILSV